MEQAKPVRKQNLTRNSHSRSFMHFRIAEKPTTDCVWLNINDGLISNVSEEIARENAENCHCRQHHCRLTPSPQETSANIRTNLISPEPRVIDLHFAANSMGLSSFNFVLVGSEKRIFSAIECISAVQGHPRSKERMRLPISH